jgi:hypothetical protein
MRFWGATRLVLCSVTCALLGACGGSAPAEVSTPTASVAAIPAAEPAAGRTLLDWPEFGLDPQRSSVSEGGTGISSDSVGRLRRVTVRTPGTVDSSPIYLHAASASVLP